MNGKDDYLREKERIKILAYLKLKIGDNKWEPIYQLHIDSNTNTRRYKTTEALNELRDDFEKQSKHFFELHQLNMESASQTLSTSNIYHFFTSFNDRFKQTEDRIEKIHTFLKKEKIPTSNYKPKTLDNDIIKRLGDQISALKTCIDSHLGKYKSKLPYLDDRKLQDKLKSIYENEQIGTIDKAEQIINVVSKFEEEYIKSNYIDDQKITSYIKTTYSEIEHKRYTFIYNDELSPIENLHNKINKYQTLFLNLILDPDRNYKSISLSSNHFVSISYLDEELYNQRNAHRLLAINDTTLNNGQKILRIINANQIFEEKIVKKYGANGDLENRFKEAYKLATGMDFKINESQDTHSKFTKIKEANEEIYRKFRKFSKDSFSSNSSLSVNNTFEKFRSCEMFLNYKLRSINNLITTYNQLYPSKIAMIQLNDYSLDNQLKNISNVRNKIIKRIAKDIKRYTVNIDLPEYKAHELIALKQRIEEGKIQKCADSYNSAFSLNKKYSDATHKKAKIIFALDKSINSMGSSIWGNKGNKQSELIELKNKIKHALALNEDVNSLLHDFAKTAQKYRSRFPQKETSSFAAFKEEMTKLKRDDDSSLVKDYEISEEKSTPYTPK